VSRLHRYVTQEVGGNEVADGVARVQVLHAHLGRDRRRRVLPPPVVVGALEHLIVQLPRPPRRAGHGAGGRSVAQGRRRTRGPGSSFAVRLPRESPLDGSGTRWRTHRASWAVGVCA